MFDARCFNIPKEEACNLVYWRQLDATRNSIQMAGQANFSHRELQGKSCNMIQDMLHEQKGINWNDYPTRWKRGVACHKVIDKVDTEEVCEPQEFGEPRVYVKKTTHYKWEIDWNMPILKGEDRNYIEDWIYVGE
jgi:tRNA(His) 5'-end guanylyltransferase